MQWIDDEEKTADTSDAIQGLFELHERATRDYLCMHPLLQC